MTDRMKSIIEGRDKVGEVASSFYEWLIQNGYYDGCCNLVQNGDYYGSCNRETIEEDFEVMYDTTPVMYDILRYISECQ